MSLCHILRYILTVLSVESLQEERWVGKVRLSFVTYKPDSPPPQFGLTSSLSEESSVENS